MSRFDSLGGAGGMLDDLKSRLGFGGKDDSRNSSNRDDSYDNYDSYGDGYDDGYGDYGDGYDDGYSNYSSDYDDKGYAPVGGYRPASSRSSRSGRGGYDETSPRLVSIDDVKAHTSVPDHLTRDPLAPSSSSTQSSTSRYSSRTVLDETVPPVSSPAHNAAMRDARQRSEGLDSLFESTAPSSVVGSYDPYVAYSSSSPSSHEPKRSLTVLRPTAYGDVERVSKAVKAGDVVVLVLNNAPDDLAKRILDFSFGVASALDANVECPAKKVFAIARGSALSEDEKRRLRNQGAL